MDIIIGKAKHWQIFGSLMLVLIVHSNMNQASELLRDISYILFIGINIGWVLMMGTFLKRKSKIVGSTNYNLFLGTGVLLITLVGVFRLLSTTKEIFQFMDSSILLAGVGLYVIISIGILYSFPVKVLNSMETKDEVGVNNYFGDMFLLLFWPIGIWFIQPRLNKFV